MSRSRLRRSFGAGALALGLMISPVASASPQPPDRPEQDGLFWGTDDHGFICVGPFLIIPHRCPFT